MEKRIWQVGYYNWTSDYDSSEFEVIKTFDNEEDAKTFRKMVRQSLLMEDKPYISGYGQLPALDISAIQLNGYILTQEKPVYVNEHVPCLLYIYFNRYCGGSKNKPCAFDIHNTNWYEATPDKPIDFNGSGIMYWTVEYDPEKKYEDYLTQQMYNYLKGRGFDEQAADLEKAAGKDFASNYPG